MQNKIKLSLVASVLLNTSLYAQNDLGTVTVTSATKSEQSIKDITSDVEVIRSVELEEKHIVTVSEALNLIGGVSFTSNGGIGATTSIHLRGMNNNRTLVLIDGVRFQDPSNTSGSNIAHLMIADIEKIEVIKGAQSGIWGADASAGVVNIITKNAKDGTTGSLLVEAGSFNTKKIAGVLSHKEKNYDVKLSTQKIKSDGFTVQAPNGEDISKYEDDKYENTTLNLKANYNIDDSSQIKADIKSIDALKEYDSYNNPDDENMKSDIKNKLYNITYENRIKNHNLKVKLEKSEFEREELGTVAMYGSEYVKGFDGENNNVELSDTLSYNKKDFVIFGFGTSSDKVDYTMTNNISTDQKNNNKYLYLTNSNNFDKTIFTQSARYDNYDNFDNKMTGKIGIKHNLNKATFVSSNIGTAYNVPNIMQELNPWGAVNSDLNPENSKSADISFGYKDIKITYFYNKVTDLIEWYDPDGWGGDPAIYKNLDGESTFKGVELSYKTTIKEDYLVSLNYTNLNAKDKDGNDLARRAKENLKVSVDYYGIDKLHISLRSEYVGQRFDDSAKTKQTGKYTVSNLVANYDIKKDLKVYTKIDNITDKYYQTVDGYATSPRAYYAGIKYSF